MVAHQYFSNIKVEQNLISTVNHRHYQNDRGLRFEFHCMQFNYILMYLIKKKKGLASDDTRNEIFDLIVCFSRNMILVSEKHKKTDNPNIFVLFDSQTLLL